MSHLCTYNLPLVEAAEGHAELAPDRFGASGVEASSPELFEQTGNERLNLLITDASDALRVELSELDHAKLSQRYPSAHLVVHVQYFEEFLIRSLSTSTSTMQIFRTNSVL